MEKKESIFEQQDVFFLMQEREQDEDRGAKTVKVKVVINNCPAELSEERVMDKQVWVVKAFCSGSASCVQAGSFSPVFGRS